MGIVTSIALKNETNNVMKVIKSLEKSGLLIKDIMERIENETNWKY